MSVPNNWHSEDYSLCGSCVSRTADTRFQREIKRQLTQNNFGKKALEKNSNHLNSKLKTNFI